MNTSTKTLIPLLAIGIAVSACTPAADPQVAGGGSGSESAGGGKVSVACSQVEDYCEAMIKQFQEATGIEANYVSMGAGAAIARLSASKDAPEFDVWAGGQAENHLVAADQGLIENYVSGNASNLDEQNTDKDGIWSGFYTGALGFCSSEEQLAALGLEVPTSWDDLLDPKLKGHVGMPHPASVGAGYMAMYAKYVIDGKDEAKTIDYFTKLNQNVLQYGNASTTAGEMVGRGELATSISLVADCERLAAQGYELTVSYPEEGAGYEVGAVSVVKGAKNPENAKKFYDWILTTDWQNAYGDIPTYALPVNPDATIREGATDITELNLVPWDKREAADQRQTMIDAFTQQIAPAPKA